MTSALISQPDFRGKPSDGGKRKHRRSCPNASTFTKELSNERFSQKKREPAESVAVKMDDGRTVDFVGKRRMLKEGITIDGQPALRMDFSNGETRQFIITENFLHKFAQHGAAQKFGDETSGLDDVEDCIIAVDALADRLAAGNWGIVRTNNGMAGTSVLARALAELSGKSMDEVKKVLAAKTQGEKVELRRHPKIAPIVARLEVAKSAKAKLTHDTDAILGELGVGAVNGVSLD